MKPETNVQSIAVITSANSSTLRIDDDADVKFIREHARRRCALLRDRECTTDPDKERSYASLQRNYAHYLLYIATLIRRRNRNER